MQDPKLAKAEELSPLKQQFTSINNNDDIQPLTENTTAKDGKLRAPSKPKATNLRSNSAKKEKTKAPQKQIIKEEGEWDDRLKILGKKNEKDEVIFPAHLEVHYTGLFYTSKGFYDLVNQEIADTNQKIRLGVSPEELMKGIKQAPDRISKLPALTKPLDRDIVFKYEVRLYGRTWKVYKSIDQFEDLSSGMASFLSMSAYFHKIVKLPELDSDIKEMDIANEMSNLEDIMKNYYVPTSSQRRKEEDKKEQAAQSPTEPADVEVKLPQPESPPASPEQTFHEKPLPPTIDLNNLEKVEKMSEEFKLLVLHEYGKVAPKLFFNRLLDVKEKQIEEHEFKVFLEFWGISKAFCKVRFEKVAEVYASKYTQGRKNNNCVVRIFKSAFNWAQKRWFCISYNNIWYYKESSDEPSQMKDNVMVDTSSQIKVYTVTKREVVVELIMSRRRLKLKCSDPIHGLYVVKSLVEAFNYSNYSRIHKFASFAPIRPKNDCKFYIDGQGYFEDLHKKLKNAQDEIMIAGWFISPEMPLLRPVSNPVDGSAKNFDHLEKDEKKRLENLKKDLDPTSLAAMLGKAAERGVRVYVLVYKEFESQMYNDSEWCKAVLETLNNKNIKVLRHPTSMSQAIYWSHHEKICIVDRRVVFMGGLDIAWGRWDTQKHDLFDYSSTGNLIFPGIDYYNPFKKEILKGRDWKNTPLQGRVHPRMPWHDVSIRLKGPIVFDFLTHFVTYWNNSRELNNDSEVLFTQMSLTNPKYYISNSIKDLIRLKVNNKSIIDLFLANLNYSNPEDLHDPTGKVESTSVQPDLNTNAPNHDMELSKDDIHLDNSRDEHFGGPNLMRDDGDLEGEMDIENNRTKYGDKLFFELDNNYEKDNWMAPADIHKEIGVGKIPFFAPYGQPKAVFDFKDEMVEGSATISDKNNGEEVMTENLNLKLSSKKSEVVKDKQLVSGNTGQLIDGSNYAQAVKRDAQIEANKKAGIVPEQSTLWHFHKRESIFNTEQNELEVVSLEAKAPKDSKLQDRKIVVRRKYNMSKIPKPEIRVNVKDLEGVQMDEGDNNKVADEGEIRTDFAQQSHKKGVKKSIYSVDGNLSMQALRSASPWSIGLQAKEISIQNCYFDIIRFAKRFVYIENQFFISSTSPEADQDEFIRNRIVKAIYTRIKHAIRCKEEFKVIVFMPLLPAFEADLRAKQGEVMQIQIELENQTIGKGPNSLYGKISQLTNTPDKYLMFCGLRKYQYPPVFDPNAKGKVREDFTKTPHTELIYIHSKVA